jgi:hypothetical protein
LGGLKASKHTRVFEIAIIQEEKYIRVFLSSLQENAKNTKKNTSLTQFHIKQKHKERYENTYATLAFPFDNNNIHTRFVFFSCYLLRPPTAFFSAGLCGSGSVVVPATPFPRYGTL